MGIYKANTYKWQPGDLVLADADAKRPEMLMVVLPRTVDQEPDIIRVRYVSPQRGWGTEHVYSGEYQAYHDPAGWLELRPNVDLAKCSNVLSLFREKPADKQRKADDPEYLAERARRDAESAEA